VYVRKVSEAIYVMSRALRSSLKALILKPHKDKRLEFKETDGQFSVVPIVDVTFVVDKVVVNVVVVW